MRIIFFLFLFFPIISVSQNTKKEVAAKRISSKVNIDGKLDESIWHDIDKAQDFIMMKPENGKYERSTQKTEVKFAYDNNAIYIGAKLFDSNPYAILQELGARDNQNKNADSFGIFINPFNDGINEFCFMVTAAGVQIDKKITLSTDGYKEELNWDSVWESEVIINEQGWFVEMRIPYSAIRFPNIEHQTWGLNIYRQLRRLREEYSWNYIDIRKNHFGNQAGLLKGISNIESPIRLSLIPYLSAQLENFENDNNGGYGGGIDLKYGINESFTLDLTLVPDFQQVQFDPLTLNTSPFEIKFDENRSFFTEGIELFEKGNLFYSRRIGDQPNMDIVIQENEIIVNNIENIKLINAMKISGRTNTGYGLGFFNGITANTYAELKDTILNTKRKELIEPLTNYNMLVIDKSFNKNSFLTFINTNVSRKRDFRNANVTGLLAGITNKKNTHTLDLNLKGSNVIENRENKYGFSSLASIKKINNTIQYSFRNYIESDEYDINDMGFLYQNNEINNEYRLSYNIFSPINKILRGSMEIATEHKMLYKPILYNALIIKSENELIWKNHLYTKLGIRYFFEEHDYFESRADDQKFIRPPALKIAFTTSSDYRKAFSLNTRFSSKIRISSQYNYWNQHHNQLSYIRINPRIRINNHLFFQYILAYEKDKNQFGWLANLENENILFSRRQQKTLTNKLIVNQTFSTKSYIELTLRHYWSTLINSSYYNLQDDGYLESNITNEDNYDINFNSWNIDLKYSLEFKPGSFISLVWQNQLSNQSEQIENIFLRNINDLFENPSSNIFSIKFTYYIDIQEYINK